MPSPLTKIGTALPRRIYLAGPEVFHPQAKEIGEAKARLCAAAGFEGIFPLDTSLDLTGLSKREQATRIYRADIEIMHRCDVMIGNLTPFRGVSMDSGTAFEAGYMRALGRPVLGYSNTIQDYRKRADGYRAASRTWPDADGPSLTVEDFELTENLMIEIAIRESGFEVVRKGVAFAAEMTDLGGFEACLEQLRAAFATSLVTS
jgi:nucleoside 2-deoxyribosyltransferase